MDSQKVIILTTGAVLSVVLIVAFVLPIVTSSTADTVEIKNEGIYFENVTTGTHTIVYDQNNGETILTVDNVDISDKLHSTYSNPADRQQPLAYGDYFNISYSSKTDSITVYSQHESHPSVYVKSGTITLTPTSADFQLVNESSVNVVFTLTVSNVCMVSVDDQAEYVYCKNPMLADDTEVKTSLIYSISNFHIWRVINGTLDDLEVKSYSTVNGAEVALSNIEVTKTLESVPAYTNISQLTSLSVKATGGGTTSGVVIDYLIVPASITAEKASVPSDAEISLIELIPLLLAVGVILSIIGYARMRA